MTTRIPPPLTADPSPVANFDVRPTRIGANCLLIPVMRDLGHDPAPVFAAAGIDMEQFVDPEAMVPMHKLAAVLRLIIVSTGRRDLGLLVAERADLTYAGLLGTRLAAEPNLRSALATLIRLAPINTRSVALRLVVDDAEARLEIASLQPFSDVAATYNDALAAITYNNLRNMLGGIWPLLGVEFAYQATAAPAVYQRIFGVRPRFNLPVTALVFARSDLDRRMPGHEAPLQFELAARAAAARLALDVEDRVRAMIRAHVDNPRLSRPMIARLLGMSSRTLARRLVERDVTFATLLRDTRLAAAQHLLADADIALGDIAVALGYADQSAFARAFRHWTGTSPRAWRAAHRH